VSDEQPYEALLLVSFGGPESVDEVVPFLRRVTSGRGIPDERLEQVGAHYFHFDGVSPINAQNRALIAALGPALDDASLGMPIYWGNLYSEPFVPDAIEQMRADGITKAVAFVTSVYSSGPGCRRYREAIAAACGGSADVDADGMRDAGSPRIDKLRHGFDHPGFIEPFIDGVVDAVEPLPAGTRLAFTTHSLPLSAATASGPPGRFEQGAYVSQHRAVAELVAHAASDRTGRDLLWDLVFQSRSGPPSQPWLAPDISDHLDELVAEGVPGVVVVPIGFVSDHMEVMWDLDTAAAEHAASLGLPFARVSTPGTDPRFVAMIVDLVREQINGVAISAQTAMSPLGPWPQQCPRDCCITPERAARP